MDDNYEIALRKVCCTCLSVDRKLSQLCRIPDGVNNLYYLLSYDVEAYREGFYKGSSNFFICWECKSLMKRFCEFRDQACVAKKHLSLMMERWNDVKPVWKCLSRLSMCKRNKFDHIFISDEISPELHNFVDCGLEFGVKDESDTDEIPLSHLYDNESNIDTISMTECNKINEPRTGNIDYKYKRKQKSVTGRCSKTDVNSFGSENGFPSLEVAGEEMFTSFDKIITVTGNMCYSSNKCTLCGSTFDNVTELEKHNWTEHKIDRKTKRLKKPGSKPRRNRTIIDKRDDGHAPRGYPCSECDKHFDNKNARYKHIQRLHREGFSCSTCGKRFAFRNNLKRHELLHAGPMPREQCPTCGKLVRSDLARAHSRTHAQRDTFACASCDKRFVSRASYEHHLKYTRPHATRDILKYKCTECTKGYRSKGELRDHVNYQHMGRTQHKCPICEKALATPRCVTRHVRRAHTGIRETARDKICQTCGKTFRDKKGLREHELIHSGERPLSCPECGRSFRQSASLYTHRRRVHSVAPPKPGPRAVLPSQPREVNVQTNTTVT